MFIIFSFHNKKKKKMPKPREQSKVFTEIFIMNLIISTLDSNKNITITFT